MRAIASESSALAALESTTVSSPRFLFQTTPTCLPPVGPCSLARSPQMREVNHHGQRPASPVLQTSRTALVLLDQQPARQLVFIRVSGLSGQPCETTVCYADRYLRVSAEVLHPIREVASSREHVEGASLRHEGEPDLDLVRRSRHPPRRRQVAEVLSRERTQISHWHQASGLHGRQRFKRPFPDTCSLHSTRSSTRRILPLVVLGSSFMNSILRGYLYGAVFSLQ